MGSEPMERVEWDADHPASHFRCTPDCPCTCSHRKPYASNIGTTCCNCWGVIERTHHIITEPVLTAGGITLLASRREQLPRAS